MAEKKFDNILLFVSDSLRYDSVPDKIASDSEVIPTLAPSLHTPTSFASLFTARSPENHNVKNFLEDLDDTYPTAFDTGMDSSFYVKEEPSSINRHIFRSDGRDLDAMEPPFLWIERGMETHIPYGVIGHESPEDFEFSGREYIQRGARGEIDLHSEYQKGTDALADHLSRHMDELEDRGILDDTLVVLTSDHGDLLGERFLGQRRFDHNYPPMRELVEVPTVFLNADVDAECMRLIDVLPTALAMTGRDPGFGDGVDVRGHEVREGVNVMEDVKAEFRTRWRFRDGHWRPTWRSRAQIVGKTLLGDLKRAVYRGAYSPVKERLEDLTEEPDETSDLDI